MLIFGSVDIFFFCWTRFSLPLFVRAIFSFRYHTIRVYVWAAVSVRIERTKAQRRKGNFASHSYTLLRFCYLTKDLYPWYQTGSIASRNPFSTQDNNNTKKKFIVWYFWNFFLSVFVFHIFISSLCSSHEAIDFDPFFVAHFSLDLSSLVGELPMICLFE